MKSSKKMIMYLRWVYEFGKDVWYWTYDKRGDADWTGAYWVKIPEEFSISKSKDGETLFFRGDNPTGYELFISNNSGDGVPVLVGGSPSERIFLKVVGRADE